MIEEQFVSFETAKILKEARFDVPICKHYTRSGATWTSAVPEIIDDSKDCTWFPCPTQALAARWLREVHRIVVDVTFIPPLFDGVNWQYFIGNMDDMVWEGDFEPSERRYATYEAALEAGLQEAIKLIKK